MIVCEGKKWVGGKIENSILYYFIELYVKKKKWNVRWVIKWVVKIDKIVFEDVK